MKSNEVNQSSDEHSRKHAGKDANLSPDGKWKSFPKVPNLLQYVPTQTFFGRTKLTVSGRKKVIRKSLETTVFSTAKLKLGDFLKEQGAARIEGPRTMDTFRDARLRYEERLDLEYGTGRGVQTVSSLLHPGPGGDLEGYNGDTMPTLG
ncbi:MAG: hypothetical protein AB9869_04660 [Verrucomicrobiia bacterium]